MAMRLEGQLNLDGSGWQRGLNAVSTATKSFISGSLNSLAGNIAAAFSVGALTNLTKKTIEYAGHINDLSDRLGVSTDYLQEMQYITKQSGADVDELTKTFEKLGAARQAALEGGAAGDKALANFQKFGISLNDLQSSSTENLMDKIAARFKELGSNDEIKTAFKEIGGRGAAALVPSFINGIEQGRENARNAGAVLSEETILQLDEIGDKFDTLAIKLMTNLAPTIIQFADAIGYLGDKIGQTQSILGEILGNIGGAASPKELLDANERAQKYKDQIDRRVASGELTPEEGKRRLKQTLGNADISQFDPLAGVNQAFSETVQSQQAQAQADEAARNAKIEERRRQREERQNAVATLPQSAKALQPNNSNFAIGNFLGSGRGVIQSINERQLEVARKHFELAKETKISIDKNTEAINKSGIGVPLH